MGYNDPVRAAGGVLVRRSPHGEPEVLVVHRQRYDDWSFPKGKNEAGESDEQCALREVHEETGLTCRLLDELPTASYFDRKGRPKTVRYWTLEQVGGEFTPNDEVDRAEWVDLQGALDRLSYGHDRAMVEDLIEDEINRASLLLIRHGTAGSRGKWKRDDKLRPLDAKGKRQTTELAEILAVYPIKRIVSSPYLRCLQTVEPLADRLGLEIEIAEVLAEGTKAAKIRKYLESLSGELVAACVHGHTTEAVLGPDVMNKKGGVWVFRNEGGEFKPSRYIVPPSAK